LIAFAFTFAAIFSPGFMSGGATIATVVLGFFGTMVTALVAASAAQRTYSRGREDREENRANGDKEMVERE
jgi:hypothetical protein